MFAWVDTETNGLESDLPTSRLLEVAIVFTDNDLNILSGKSLVIRHDNPPTLGMDDYVRKMHERSGLLAELANPDNPTLGEAEVQLVKWFNAETGLRTPPMAGNSIQFDRRWLEGHMPRLAAQFHYRNADVSSVRNFCRAWRKDVTETEEQLEKSGNHRAMGDLMDSIQLAKHYKTHIFEGAAS